MDQSRRSIPTQMVGVVAAAAAAGLGAVEAAAHQHVAEISAPTAEGWKLAADIKFHCGTCQL